MLCEAVDYAGEYMATKLDAAPSALDALDELFAEFRKQLQHSDFRAGCPVVAVAVEAGDPTKPDQAKPVIERAAAAFGRWREVIGERLIADGVPAQHAGALALLVLSSFEGALVIARAARDLEPLDTVQAQLRLLIGAQTPPPGRKRAPR